MLMFKTVDEVKKYLLEQRTLAERRQAGEKRVRDYANSAGVIYGLDLALNALEGLQPSHGAKEQQSDLQTLSDAVSGLGCRKCRMNPCACQEEDVR